MIAPILLYKGHFEGEDDAFGEIPKVLGKFYFWDEGYALWGPYDTLEAARIAVTAYFEAL